MLVGVQFCASLNWLISLRRLNEKNFRFERRNPNAAYSIATQYKHVTAIFLFPLSIPLPPIARPDCVYLSSQKSAVPSPLVVSARSNHPSSIDSSWAGDDASRMWECFATTPVRLRTEYITISLSLYIYLDPKQSVADSRSTDKFQLGLFKDSDKIFIGSKPISISLFSSWFRVVIFTLFKSQNIKININSTIRNLAATVILDRMI